MFYTEVWLILHVCPGDIQLFYADAENIDKWNKNTIVNIQPILAASIYTVITTTEIIAIISLENTIYKRK